MKIRTIQDAVCQYYGLTIEELLGNQRCRRIAWPRQMAMWLCLRVTYASTVQVGDAFNRDHTTVMHAREAVKRRLDRGHVDTVRAERNVMRLFKGAPKEPKLIGPLPSRKRAPKATKEMLGIGVEQESPKKQEPRKKIPKATQAMLGFRLVTPSREYRKSPRVMQSFTKRPCITCGSEFKSEGAHNRMCPPCREGNSEAISPSMGCRHVSAVHY